MDTGGTFFIVFGRKLWLFICGGGWPDWVTALCLLWTLLVSEVGTIIATRTPSIPPLFFYSWWMMFPFPFSFPSSSRSRELDYGCFWRRAALCVFVVFINYYMYMFSVLIVFLRHLCRDLSLLFSFSSLLVFFFHPLFAIDSELLIRPFVFGGTHQQ
jgi:hypothetical protein